MPGHFRAPDNPGQFVGPRRLPAHNNNMTLGYLSLWGGGAGETHFTIIEGEHPLCSNLNSWTPGETHFTDIEGEHHSCPNRAWAPGESHFTEINGEHRLRFKPLLGPGGRHSRDGKVDARCFETRPGPGEPRFTEIQGDIPLLPSRA